MSVCFVQEHSTTGAPRRRDCIKPGSDAACDQDSAHTSVVYVLANESCVAVHMCPVAGALAFNTIFDLVDEHGKTTDQALKVR